MLQRHRFLLEAIVIVVIAGIIGVIVALAGGNLSRYGSLIPPAETGEPVVINEVSLAFLEDDPGPHQWFELYNVTSDWMTLNSWSIETGSGSRLALPEVVLAPQGYAIVAGSEETFLADHVNYLGQVVSPSGLWPGLNRGNDFLVLRNPQGAAVDAVNWGVVDNAPADVQLWEDAKFGGGAPWMVDQDGNLKVQLSFERWPIGVDRNVPADFINQYYPSPGTVNLPSATPAADRLFIIWTNIASYAGGILLWVAFVFIALIARRFEALTQQRTFWQAMLFTPSGIMAYMYFQAKGFLERGRMNDPEKWWGFTLLFASAVLCTALVFIFRQRAKRILEG